MDEFTQLFAHGARQPQLPTKPTTTLELDLRRISRRHRALPLAMHLMKLFPQPEHLGEFMDYLEKVKLAPGEPLFSQGDQPEALYIIEVGQIDTQALLPEQPARSFWAGEWGPGSSTTEGPISNPLGPRRPVHCIAFRPAPWSRPWPNICSSCWPIR